MNWQKWVIIFYIALGLLVTIASVGKKREPMTGSAAALTTLFSAGLIWLVVIA